MAGERRETEVRESWLREEEEGAGPMSHWLEEVSGKEVEVVASQQLQQSEECKSVKYCTHISQ